jgi:hypothetical protein
MRRKNLLFVVIIIIILLFSGCFEQEEPTSQNPFEGITLESSVAELVNASLDFHRDGTELLRVEVKYLFHNIADRNIELEVKVEFYDEIDNLLYTSETKEIDLPEGYTEAGFGPANTITYDGDKVADVDHVKIIATEKEYPE